LVNAVPEHLEGHVRFASIQLGNVIYERYARGLAWSFNSSTSSLI